MLIHKIAIPPLVQHLMPSNTYCYGPKEQKSVYLTFDDGPVEGVTNRITEILRQYSAKATFFCVGENIIKNRGIYDQVVAEGHLTGNHTHNHLKGWTTTLTDYWENVALCRQQVPEKIFRPPYGKITPRQWRLLSTHYKVIFWSLLSGDFDSRVSPDSCSDQVIRKVRPGSIVVFHDSQKAARNVLNALPKVLDHLTEKGYQCKTLNQIL